MKRRNARPFLCTYSSACPPPHPWVDQGSDLAPTCSPCLSPHLLKATPLISFPLSDSSFEWEIVLRTGIQIPQLLDLTLEIQTQISSSASLHSILASKQDWSQHQDFQPNLPTKQLSAPRRTASTALVFARNEDGIFGSTAKRWEITTNSQHRPKSICRNGPRVPVATNNLTKNATFRPEDLNKSNFGAAGAKTAPNRRSTRDAQGNEEDEEEEEEEEDLRWRLEESAEVPNHGGAKEGKQYCQEQQMPGHCEETRQPGRWGAPTNSAWK